jgi:hypothetical protein
LINNGITISRITGKKSEEVSQKKKRQPQNSQPGICLVDETVIHPHPELFVCRTVSGIIRRFIRFNELILKVMVDKNRGEVGIIGFPVTVDHPVPLLLRMPDERK